MSASLHIHIRRSVPCTGFKTAQKMLQHFLTVVTIPLYENQSPSHELKISITLIEGARFVAAIYFKCKLSGIIAMYEGVRVYVPASVLMRELFLPGSII